MLFGDKLNQRERYIQGLIKSHGIDERKLPTATLSGVQYYHTYIDGLSRDIGLTPAQTDRIKRYLSSSIAYSDRFIVALIYAGKLEPNRLNEGTSVLSICLCQLDVQMSIVRGDVSLFQLLKGDEVLQAKHNAREYSGCVGTQVFLDDYVQINKPHNTRSSYR